MEELACKKCGNSLIYKNGILVCPECGSSYSLNSNEKQSNLNAVAVTSDPDSVFAGGSKVCVNRKFNKYIYIALAVLILACTALACNLVLRDNKKTNEVQTDVNNTVGSNEFSKNKNQYKNAIDSDGAGNPLSKNSKESDFISDEFNMLVIGCDNKGYTDVIMMFEIYKDRVIGHSIPRDTLLDEKVLKDFRPKYNGVSEIISLLNDNLSLKTDYYVQLYIEDVEKIIDSMGGLVIDVPFDMKYEDACQDLTINLKKGNQLLNGNKVCQLLRYRSGYATGDLGRINMQQFVLKELIEQKITKLDFNTLEDIYNTMSGDVITNYPVSAFEKHMTMISGFESGNFEFSTIPGKVSYYSDRTVYIPDHIK